MFFNVNKLDENNFSVKQFNLNGEIVNLVQPARAGTTWTKSNIVLRSSVWNSKNELISAGFPKFFNWNENNNLIPHPSKLNNTCITEKLDGSLFIVSKYKGEFILRTRGTLNARELDNGYEISEFEKNYLPSCNVLNDNDTWDFSLLFEWTSPDNKIIIDYGNKPSWILIGGVYHKDYSLFTQNKLNSIAESFDWKRPKLYSFPNVDSLLSNINNFKDKEGVVVYSKNDQVLHKCKSTWYLKLHHLKSELSSVEKLLDVWLNNGKLNYNDFYNFISVNFDFEIAEYCKSNISKICDAYKTTNSILNHMKSFVDNKVRILKSRKDQANTIMSAYGNTNRSSFVFNILDNKPITNEIFKKLMFQSLK